jgi:hypothetical protein
MIIRTDPTKRNLLEAMSVEKLLFNCGTLEFIVVILVLDLSQLNPFRLLALFILHQSRITFLVNRPRRGYRDFK